MKRVKYCCDTTALCRYYDHQVGTGLGVFKGGRNQAGYGIGSLFSGLFRAVLPLFKSAGRTLGKTALHTGLNVASDVLKGRDLKESVVEHGNVAKRQLMEKASQKLGELATQTGSGARKKRRNKRKRLHRDIFN